MSQAISKPLPSRRLRLTPEGLAGMYILLIPFLHYFAITSVLPLPMVFMSLVTVGLFFQRKLVVVGSDLLLLIVVLLGMVGGLFAWEDVGPKNLSHLIAITSTILVYYVAVRSLLLQIYDLTKFGKPLAFALLYVSLFIAFEFSTKNFLGFDVHSVLPAPPVETSLDATVFGLFLRPRGFAIEAGAMAFFFEMAIPLSYWHVRTWSTVARVAYYAVIAVAYILLFSAGSFSALMMAGSLTFLLIGKKNWRSIIKVTLAAVIIAMLTALGPGQMYFEQVIAPKAIGLVQAVGILSASDEINNSSEDRGQRYLKLIELVQEAPYGIGWGTASQLGSEGRKFRGIALPEGFTSFPGEICAAGGLLALTFLLLFFALKLRQILSRRGLLSTLLFVSVLTQLVHYCFSSDYWFPFLWFSLAVGDLFIALTPRSSHEAASLVAG